MTGNRFELKYWSENLISKILKINNQTCKTHKKTGRYSERALQALKPACTFDVQLWKLAKIDFYWYIGSKMQFSKIKKIHFLTFSKYIIEISTYSKTTLQGI